MRACARTHTPAPLPHTQSPHTHTHIHTHTHTHSLSLSTTHIKLANSTFSQHTKLKSAAETNTPVSWTAYQYHTAMRVMLNLRLTPVNANTRPVNYDHEENTMPSKPLITLLYMFYLLWEGGRAEGGGGGEREREREREREGGGVWDR